jgi:hypothetical protein
MGSAADEWLAPGLQSKGVKTNEAHNWARNGKNTEMFA